MKTKFTKGEWSQDHTNPRQINIRDQKLRLICGVPYDCSPPVVGKNEIEDVKEIQANAKLISAAPKLLEALQGIVDFEQRMRAKGTPMIGTSHMNKAYTAIRKATQ